VICSRFIATGTSSPADFLVRRSGIAQPMRQFFSDFLAAALREPRLLERRNATTRGMGCNAHPSTQNQAANL
jgi:hypothetical protein